MSYQYNTTSGKCTGDKKNQGQKNAFEKVSTLYPRPYTTTFI